MHRSIPGPKDQAPVDRSYGNCSADSPRSLHTSIDGAISKLHFSAFYIIPYHACWMTNIDLQTFFVFPNTDEEIEDEEDEMETDKDNQDKAKPEEEVPSNADEDYL
jgi:hypothetical protein